MKILLGLGNPGTRYAATRHNVGWMVLDAIAARLGVTFRAGLGEYEVAEARWRGRNLALVRPTTYMNNSGRAARHAVKVFNAEPAELLALVDEVQFAVGKIKLTPSGSDGGHNGTASLIEELGTPDFPRLRCGVGSDFGPGELVDYVLSSFREDESEELAAMIARGVDAALLWIVDGTQKAMNRVNAKEKKPEPAPTAPEEPPRGGGEVDARNGEPGAA